MVFGGAFFGDLIDGVVRAPEVPIQVQTDILKTDRQFMGGKATWKDVRLRGASSATIGREGI